MKRLCLALVLVLASCTSAPPQPTPTPLPDVSGPATTLRVLAGSELADLRPVLDEAARATGVTVKMTFTGSLEGAQTVADGKADGNFDALWFSSTRYLETVPEARQRLGTSTRIMGSPVVLGLRRSVADRLGWGARQVGWLEIAAAAGRGEFTFAMTDPAASNTGFSALVAIASALDGSGRALDTAAIDRVAPQLAGFFAAQRLTAGSSGWLTDAFTGRGELDGLVNYEASLVALNKSGKLTEPLTLIYPRDGVISADYPLTLLGGSGDAARDAHKRLSEFLRFPDTQRKITELTSRRAAVPGVALPQGFPDKLSELPFPGTRDAVDALLTAYFDRLRRPSRTVYVLDTSGSMQGERLAALKRSLSTLTGVDTSLTGKYCRFRSREDVVLLPFNHAPLPVRAFTVDAQNPQPSRDAIRGAIDGLVAAGDTAVYDSLVRAYDELTGTDRFLSIVLMTDGESNTGRSLADFTAFAAGRQIRVFPILFGEAAESQMREVATLTGGELFDARDSDLAQVFCQIRGYQ
ncbi:VWA domain-containing protein [Lentzea guizhouensis]|uniref:VWA domain-containing protein n=1 Tax=Lentzea guizhouensis TaxID=1586287 RepID=UPI000A87AC8B|nr:VWA domain-containing protein [Lentzea guizhouensis]